MRVFFLVIGLALSLPEWAQKSDISEKLDAYLRQMNEQGLNASVLCIRDGNVLLSRGYGFANKEENIPNSTQTVSTVGSITKQFTAAAILVLESQGKLRTDMTLDQLLPNVPSDKAKITIHQMLTMSAGFVETLGDDYEKLDRSAFLARAFESPLQFQPGTSFLYSNVSYSVLGAIVEIISGKDYDTYCRENIWLPAGMQHTGYVKPDWSKSVLAVGYNKQGENTGTSLQKVWDEDGPFWNLKCNGGVLSTCEDMYKWYIALKGETILSAEQKNKMYTPHIAEDPSGQSHYGYGWAIIKTRRDTRLITHNGGNGIFFADYLNFEDENTFVYVSSNASKRGMQDVAWELGRMILNPGYEPEIKNFNPVAIDIKEIANPEYRTTLEDLIRYLESGTSDATTDFVLNHLGPGLLESMPMDEHLTLFNSFRQVLNGSKYHHMMSVGQEYFLYFDLANGERKQLLVDLNDKGKIRGIGFPD